jgi:hypothetical protein
VAVLPPAPVLLLLLQHQPRNGRGEKKMKNKIKVGVKPLVGIMAVLCKWGV